MSQSILGITNDTCCFDVHTLNSSLQCAFVQAASDCHVEEGLLEYTVLLYCHFANKLFPLGVFILISWLAFLFIALAVAASDFFCPSLIVIARVLRMSDNIAGITLLAFGNGAPDVFSAIAAVKNMKHGDNGLVLGALLGAGVFLTTIVVGVIALVRPFKSMERPFLRDIIFYMLTVFATFVICFKKHITLFESLGFIVGYVVYVLIVVIGRVINQRRKANRSTGIFSSERQEFLDSNNFTTLITNSFNSIFNNNTNNTTTTNNNNNNATSSSARTTNRNNNNNTNNNLINNKSINDDVDDEALLRNHNNNNNDGDDDDGILNRDDELLCPVHNDSNEENLSQLTYHNEIDNRELIDGWQQRHTQGTHIERFLHVMSPVDVVEWHFSSSWQRVYAIVKAPVIFAFRLTIPVVDVTRPLSNWNKHAHALHCITTTLFSLFAISPSFALQRISGVFPVYGFFIIAGACMGIIIITTTSPLQPPIYHSAFAFLGFLAAVLWIKTIASEIVNILQTIGVVFSISNAILGLTLLAWGNSIGDFISDVSMARRGFPRAGFSACFGGPLFNTLLGIGIPFTAITLSSPNHTAPFSYDAIAKVLFVSLAVSLVTSFLLIPAKGFRLTRLYGGLMVLLYVVFLIIALMVEENVIRF